MTDDPTATRFAPDDEMLLVEDLMLLLLDDEKGSVAAEHVLPYILGGAVLVELAMLGRVEQDARRSLLTGRKVVATGAGPLPDPLLHRAYDTLAEKPRGAQSALLKIGGGLYKSVPKRLVERDLVRAEQGRALGIFPRTRHPATDTSHEAGLRRALRSALTGEAPADPRTAALIALLSASGTLKATLRDLDPPLAWLPDVKQRAKALQDGNWGAKAVSDAVKTAGAAGGSAATTAAIAAS